MDAVIPVILASAAFVGTHFLLSHPLRAPIVARIGERGFLGLYSLVAAVTLGWMVVAYRAAPDTTPLWPMGDAVWAVVSAVMLVAAILLMGSLVRNPALPDPDRAPTIPDAARGVYAITRHPMLWSFALWGIAHIAVYPVAKNIAIAVSIIVLSLIGAALQDAKKARLFPDQWRDWEAKTSYMPFAAIATGRARAGGIGMHALGGGVAVWLIATWAHLPLAGWTAGIWRWIL